MVQWAARWYSGRLGGTVGGSVVQWAARWYSGRLGGTVGGSAVQWAARRYSGRLGGTVGGSAVQWAARRYSGRLGGTVGGSSCLSANGSCDWLKPLSGPPIISGADKLLDGSSDWCQLRWFWPLIKCSLLCTFCWRFSPGCPPPPPHWEETPGQTQNPLDGLQVPSGLGNTSGGAGRLSREERGDWNPPRSACCCQVGSRQQVDGHVD